MKLSDCKLLVTGAASGLGRHFSLRLAAAGATVAAGDVNVAGLASLTEESRDLPGTIQTRKLDVGDERDIASFVHFAHEQMEGLTGLINNAGIIRDGLLVKRDRKTGDIVKLDTERWQDVIDINLTGATFMVREVVTTMAKHEQRGVIVNMSSIARHGNRGQSSYVAAKAALAANTTTWAREFAPFGIRVGAIAPGMVKTPMTDGMKDKARDALVRAIPVGRIGVPEDIWLAARFIIECDYFNGRTIDVDGGLSI